MKKIKWSSLAALSVSALAIVACNRSNQSYIKDWSVQHQGSQLKVTASFDETYQIDGEAQVPYKNYGSIFIGQNDSRQFTIGLDFNDNVFGDVDLKQVSALPTGVGFPSIVTGPLGVVDLLKDPGKWSISAYFGALSSSPSAMKSLVGAGISLSGVDSSFPDITLTQNYFTKDNRRFGSLTIYGPKLDENKKVLVPGGIFVVADLEVFKQSSSGQLTQQAFGPAPHIRFKIGKKFEVSGREAKKYRSQRAQNAAAYQFLRALEKSGVAHRR